jgi:hypothetical protein
VAETDQVDENGVVKSKRRTLRRSVRAASIMDIVVDIVDMDEDVAVEDTEVGATAEMANQNADVVAIEDVETHKQLCSSCIFADSKATGRIGLSLRCTKSYSRFAISVDTGQNLAHLPLFREFLPSWEIIRKPGRGGFLRVCSSLFFLFLCNLYHQDHGHERKKREVTNTTGPFWFGWRFSDLILRYERMDWTKICVFFSAHCSQGGLIPGWRNGLCMELNGWNELDSLLAFACLPCFMRLDLASLFSGRC